MSKNPFKSLAAILGFIISAAGYNDEGMNPASENRLYLHNASVLTPDRQLDGQALLIEDGIIQALAPMAELKAPADALPVDAAGNWLVPGFLDLQLNGGFGDDFTVRPETIWDVAAKLPRHGVTTFLPTVITSPVGDIERARTLIEAGPPSAWSGAIPLGWHIEGPFLNPGKKGAHNPDHLRRPSTEAATNWSPEGHVRLVTLAPELPGALPLIRTLARRGVVVGAGHSLATWSEAQAAFAAGVRYVTHLFNAMPALGHREPGLVGAALESSDVTVGLIADGVHVDPAMVNLAWRAKGNPGVNLVTDAMAALGMPPGQHVLADQTVVVTERDSRLIDGTLAGSILPMDAALRNLVRFTGCSLAEALASVTTTPAQLLGLTERGRIAPGVRADLVLLTPSLEIALTVVDGQILYHRDET